MDYFIELIKKIESSENTPVELNHKEIRNIVMALKLVDAYSDILDEELKIKLE
ncbi:hypothetical protein [Clostridium tagluense]|uniref:Uncharacterized protein n=1 Tax=Clostridium tagluense TaxID=360422 RepID=A0A401UTS6_9CLOT|nr:hypothetical protein [Clostridium tagluense]GCD12914.1 hypothetical protein Ctaglu_45370 [Clostridium tagluense]